MKLRENGLTSMVYRTADRIWFFFAYPNSWWSYEVPDKTDLCSLIRTIFVSAPLAVASNVAVVSFAIYALFTIVSALFPYATVVLVVILVVAGGTGIVMLIWGAGIIVSILTNALSRNKSANEAYHLAIEFYKAKKAKICPLIEITDEESSDASI